MRHKYLLYAAAILAVFAAEWLLAPASSLAQSNVWTVSAANWMQYWHHGDTREDSLDNRFNVDFNLGDFYAGTWLRVLEPYKPDMSYEKTVQRYFGWHDGGLTVHLGNFYQAFDRGLTLNAFLDDVVNFDNNLDGVKFSGLYDHYEFDALSARALNSLTGEREFIIRGARGAIKPIAPVKAGFSYVRFKQNNIVASEKAANINLTAFNSGFTYGPFDIYAEYAMKKGVDEFGNPISGDGIYFTSSVNQGVFNIYGEYKNYFRLLYPGFLGISSFNLPPPVSHQGRSLASLKGTLSEYGYQIGTLISPNYDLTFDLAFSEAYSRDSLHEYLAEKFVGVRWSPISKTTINFHWDRFDSSPNVPEGREIETYFDGYYYLDEKQTVSATLYSRRFWPNELPSYHEDYAILGYSRGSLFQINFGGSKSNNKYSSDSKKMAYVEATLRFKSHELIVFHGGERGGLLCSSGVCQVRATFRGTRVTVFSRF